MSYVHVQTSKYFTPMLYNDFIEIICPRIFPFKLIFMIYCMDFQIFYFSNIGNFLLGRKTFFYTSNCGMRLDVHVCRKITLVLKVVFQYAGQLFNTSLPLGTLFPESCRSVLLLFNIVVFTLKLLKILFTCTDL